MDVREEEIVALNQLCQANESCIPDPPSPLDQLMQANECSEPDMTALDQLFEQMVAKVLEEEESKTPLYDSAPPDLLAQVRREMDLEDGGWHNQEYAMAEVEQRLGLAMNGPC